ncbi:MAG: hypothetical protein PVF74_01960 [Anaerolineales bacterium]
MKKTFLLVSLLGVTILVLGAAGFAYAQTDTPEDPDSLFGFGKFAHRGAFGRGMGFEGGPFHDYMFPAMADALGLTEDELQDRLEAGDTHWNIIQDQGLSELTLSEFRDLMFDTIKNAINLALNDEFLTADQAEQILERVDQAYEEGRFGPGMGFGGRGKGGRGTGFGPGLAGGLINEYMVPAMAEALGISADQLTERLESGESIRDIIGESDLSPEEIQAIMQDAHSKALEAAVTDGTITQEQADLMAERMGGRFGGGLRPFGNCR